MNPTDPNSPRIGRQLDTNTRSRLVSYLIRRGHDNANQAVDAAEDFLHAAAASSQPLTPTPLADIGWHAFILHTADYAAFCQRLAGRFIHHVPHQGADCESHCNSCDARKADG